MSAALQFTLLPAKLKQAGFSTHMVGKGHLGCEPPAPHPRVCRALLPTPFARPIRESIRLLTLFALCGTDQTTDHLPIHRGFDTHLGYLEAAEHYEHGLQESCDIPAYANLPNEKAAHGQWPPPNGALASADLRCHVRLGILMLRPRGRNTSNERS